MLLLPVRVQGHHFRFEQRAVSWMFGRPCLVASDILKCSKPFFTNVERWIYFTIRGPTAVHRRLESHGDSYTCHLFFSKKNQPGEGPRHNRSSGESGSSLASSLTRRQNDYKRVYQGCLEEIARESVSFRGLASLGFFEARPPRWKLPS